MVASLLLLAAQPVVALQTPPEQVALKIDFITFDHALEWSNMPGKPEVFKDAPLGLPFEARIVKEEGRSYAKIPYLRAQTEPAFMVISSPIATMGMGQESTVMQRANEHTFTLAFKVVPDLKVPGTHRIAVSVDNAVRKVDAQYPFTYTTRFAEGETLVLAIRANAPTRNTVQMIAVRWLAQNKLPGGN